MRKTSQNYDFLVIDDKFIGISLGYDYCAEHEWGIEGIRRSFGMPESSKKNMGVLSRSITKNPPMVFNTSTKKKKKFAILYTGYSYDKQEELENRLPYELKNYQDDLIWNEEYNTKHNRDKDNLITAWCGDSFGIAVMGDKEVQWLTELHQALKSNNICIAVVNLRVKNPFSGSSLSILIKDRIPQETLDAMYSSDKEYYDLHDYEEKIGMKKIKEKHKGSYGKLHYYMACSPKWISYTDEEAREKQKNVNKTKYDIVYWINYSDDDNNYGWYTVEEIREWLTGTKKLTEIRKAH